MIEQKDAYKHAELIECAKGNMFGQGNAQLCSFFNFEIDRYNGRVISRIHTGIADGRATRDHRGVPVCLDEWSRYAGRRGRDTLATIWDQQSDRRGNDCQFRDDLA